MLEFASSMSLAVNSRAAARECVEKADASSANLIVFHSSVGHNFDQLTAAAQEAAPGATIVGCTGSGVISNEGVSEKIRALACMAVTGREQAAVLVEGVNGATSRDKAAEAAKELAGKLAGIRHIQVMVAGLDVAGDLIIEGIESVFGPDVTIFGGTAADNGKASRTIQFSGTKVVQDGLILVGFADDSLDLVTGAHHGSLPIGTPFEITRSEINRVLEIEGQPAWPFLMERLGAPAESHPSDVLPIAGLGDKLDEGEAQEYHNTHILCVSFKIDEDHRTFWLPRTAPPGSKFVLVERNEQLIFDGVDALSQRIKESIGDRSLVAMFHADCMARGRLMFNKVLKDEIITRMQGPLTNDEGTTPWLGCYGYGEFCPLGGRNRFHTYTTSLFAFVRKQ